MSEIWCKLEQIFTVVPVFCKELCCLYVGQILCQTISLGKNHIHDNPQHFHLHTSDLPVHPLPEITVLFSM